MERLTIVKVGGKVVEDKDSLEQLLAQFSQIRGKRILVHGGGSLATSLAEKLGIETRETKLGYIQRGGTPSPVDRLLATRYGSLAAELIAKEHYNCMAAINNDKMEAIPLEEVGANVKKVPPDHPLIKIGRQMGTCFGDCEQLIRDKS